MRSVPLLYTGSIIIICIVSLISNIQGDRCLTKSDLSCEQHKLELVNSIWGSSQNSTSSHYDLVLVNVTESSDCFLYMPLNKSYGEAQAICTAGGGRLAWILDDVILGALVSTDLPSHIHHQPASAWVGLFFEAGKWVWQCPGNSNQGTPFDHMNKQVHWGLNYPKNSSELRFGKLNFPLQNMTGFQNSNGSEKSHFFCQIARRGGDTSLTTIAGDVLSTEVDVCKHMGSLYCLVLIFGWVCMAILCLCLNFLCCIHVTARKKYQELEITSKAKGSELMDQIMSAKSNQQKTPPPAASGLLQENNLDSASVTL